MSCRKYRPSNGTEGMHFEEAFCAKCIHERFYHTQQDGDLKCEILTRAFLFDINDKEYPEEWVYTDNGYPTCTAHVPFDWGSDDNYDDDGNPILPIPVSPNQLALPFFFEGLDGATEQKQQKVLQALASI